jgi:hypothetical protein
MFNPLPSCVTFCCFLITASASLLLSMPTIVNAEPVINNATQEVSKDTIIATWQPTTTTLSTISDAEKLLTASRFLSASGNERQQVTQFVNRLRSSQTKLSYEQRQRLVILEARLMQGVHKFDDALQHLNTIDTAYSGAAQLLLADINIQRGQGDKAKQHCEQLMGKTSFLLAFGCVLNADFSIAPSEDVYNKLQKFERYSSLTNAESTNVAEYIWYRETLASMALALEKPNLAIQQLSEFTLSTLPVSALITWADAHYATGHYDTITTVLAQEISDISRLDDALLLRWVKAQKALNLGDTKEMRLLSKRMQIRAWREDTSHAAQVASYYLDVDYQPKLALKFARLNWEYAQTKHDEHLLKRAENALSAMDAEAAQATHGSQASQIFQVSQTSQITES